MTTFFTLAAEGLEHNTLWDPTILGVLVVMSAVGLFCGSVFLLLSTNLGARLGFLISVACLSGFMVLLSTMWITTATPLNSPKGLPAKWEVQEVVNNIEDSTIAAVRAAAEEGKPVAGEEGLAELRPGMEAGLVIPKAEGDEPVVPPDFEGFEPFETGTDFITDFEGFQSYITGGGNRFWFWHEPQYAAVEFCRKEKVEVVAGETPPTPRCDPLGETQIAVMQYNYGSLRQPPYAYFVTSLIIFGLSLLGLHWHEKDERARKKSQSTELQPIPST